MIFITSTWEKHICNPSPHHTHTHSASERQVICQLPASSRPWLPVWCSQQHTRQKEIVPIGSSCRLRDYMEKFDWTFPSTWLNCWACAPVCGNSSGRFTERMLAVYIMNSEFLVIVNLEQSVYWPSTDISMTVVFMKSGSSQGVLSLDLKSYSSGSIIWILLDLT